MSDFPEPGPRVARAPVTDEDRRNALAQHVARARPRTSSPTPPPSPAPSSDGWRDHSVELEREPSAIAVGLEEDMLAFEAEDAAADLPDLSAEPRKSRQHANANGDRPERRFDTTALHFDKHGRLMSHADYIAHCEKYDYAWRSINNGERILDVGCGTDAPLMRAINFVQGQAAKVLDNVGGCYVGVDLNKLKPTGIAWAQLLGEVDMTSEEGYDVCVGAVPHNAEILEAQDMTPEDLGHEDPESEGYKAHLELAKQPLRGYTMIVCLEVIEHMGVEDGKAMLANMRDLLSPGGRIILSTPVYDGKGQARNHVHEYYVRELQELIESVGLVVKRRMGTFTAEPQLKKWLKENRPDWLALYLEAREFHSAGYMSGVIAPMVPDIARNNVWLLEDAPGD